MPFTDTHCHLDNPAYAKLAAVCQNNRRAGVEATVAVGGGGGA